MDRIHDMAVELVTALANAKPENVRSVVETYLEEAYQMGRASKSWTQYK